MALHSATVNFTQNQPGVNPCTGKAHCGFVVFDNFGGGFSPDQGASRAIFSAKLDGGAPLANAQFSLYCAGMDPDEGKSNNSDCAANVAHSPLLVESRADPALLYVYALYFIGSCPNVNTPVTLLIEYA